jgi:hypothetical protein
VLSQLGEITPTENIGPPELLKLDAGLRTLHCKKSCLKKAQETADQTILRHFNLKRTNEISGFPWIIVSLLRPGSLRMLTMDLRAGL